MVPSPSSLLILYASQTGNAQDVAERIGREARRRHYHPRVLAMDAYDVARLPTEPFVVMVASTTGQGEPPSNMRQSWRFLLRKSLAPGSLSGVRYAVFGLGDSGYVNYNVVAKKLDRRLASLGAAAVVERGLGDDQDRGGYESALDPWLAALWAALRRLVALPPGLVEPAPSDTSTELQAKYRVTLLPRAAPSGGAGSGDAVAALETAAQAGPGDGAHAGAGPADDTAALEEAVAAAAALDRLEAAAAGMPPPGGDAAAPLRYGPGWPFMAPVAVNRRITAASHFQDTRHIELDVRGSGFTYQPGDVAAVFPRQDPDAVAQLLERVGVDPDARVRVELAEATGPGPGPGTGAAPAFEARVGALVAGGLDVNGASPRRYFFEVLSRFASAAHEAEQLAYFATPEGREDLYKYNAREGRTALEVLQEFPSARPPLEWLLQVVPRLQPRYFSLASSPAAHPGSLHITAAVVRWTTPYKRQRQGVCTSWLAQLAAGAPDARVPVWVEAGAMHLPPDPALPLVMVGPGTGVAPFRSFLHERAALAGAGPAPAPCLLFFGCRGRDADFYYADEWAALERQGALLPQGGLVTAFSRDQPKKVYVQDRVREQGALVWRLLQAGAHFYVCGSADKMPQAVAAAVESVAQQHGGLDAEAAAKFVKQLQQGRRYHVEAWS